MIGTIEDGIIARLEKASSSGALGYRLREVTSYGGQLDEDIGQIVKSLPAAWVTYAGDRQAPQRIGQNDWKIFPSFTVIFGSQNFRNEAASRRGDGTRPGSFQMLLDFRRLLAGEDLGLPIEAFAPGAAQSLFGGITQQHRLSLLALPLETSFDELQVADTSDLADFATLHADWDIPPFGDFDAVPLASEDADATDDIELETAP